MARSARPCISPWAGMVMQLLTLEAGLGLGTDGDAGMGECPAPVLKERAEMHVQLPPIRRPSPCRSLPAL